MINTKELRQHFRQKRFEIQQEPAGLYIGLFIFALILAIGLANGLLNVNLWKAVKMYSYNIRENGFIIGRTRGKKQAFAFVVAMLKRENAIGHWIGLKCVSNV